MKHLSSPTQSSTAIVCAAAMAVAGFALAGALKAQTSAPKQTQNATPTLKAADRTDSFETKMKLLEAAWKSSDFDLARSLTHSLRDTVRQAQIEEQTPGPSVVNRPVRLVDSLGAAWKRWAQGWRYFQAVSIEETAGEKRSAEPVELTLSFPN